MDITQAIVGVIEGMSIDFNLKRFQREVTSSYAKIVFVFLPLTKQDIFSRKEISIYKSGNKVYWVSGLSKWVMLKDSHDKCKQSSGTKYSGLLQTPESSLLTTGMGFIYICMCIWPLCYSQQPRLPESFYGHECINSMESLQLHVTRTSRLCFSTCVLT